MVMDENPHFIGALCVLLVHVGLRNPRGYHVLFCFSESKGKAMFDV